MADEDTYPDGAHIEQPSFDELAPSLSDVDERGDAYLDDKRAEGFAQLADAPAIYWLTLREHGLPPTACTALTTEWMHICEGADEDDE